MEPYLQKIADATQETVYFGIHHENRVLYLETRTPGEQFQYCTGLGKCLLAFGKDSYLDDISEPFPPYTVNTITRKEKLLEELEEIRKRGYSTDNMEHEFGISCVAVPLFGLSGEIIGDICHHVRDSGRGAVCLLVISVYSCIKTTTFKINPQKNNRKQC